MNYNNKYQLVGISQSFNICAPLEEIALIGKNCPEKCWKSTPLSKYFMVIKKEVSKLWHQGPYSQNMLSYR